MSKEQPWGGRFRESLAETALRFSASIDLDGKLYREDIAGSIAHAEMLAAAGIITKSEARTIVRALKEIREEFATGTMVVDPSIEDVHMAIEARLIEKIGPTGGKLHTARSRNDQVALDERLYLRGAAADIGDGIVAVQRVLVAKAEEYIAVVMPGYTHTQRAQPVLLAHHLLAYVDMLGRDRERLSDCVRRLNRSPLGAAALAGTSFPIDRKMVADALGFDGIVENSLDAVADRDYLIEFGGVCSILMMHLSRLAEELVLWSTTEFAFVEMSDAYTTGSSIMPQKKNPDMAELVRGKTGRVYGALFNLLTMMKGLPLAYNRDMQEDKAPMFDLAETSRDSLAVLAGMLEGCRFDGARMESEAGKGFSTATELADYLVRRGVPFRSAHSVVGAVVRYCSDRDMALDELDLPTLQGFSPAFDADVYPCLNAATSVTMKQSAGSTAPSEVRRQLRRWKRVLAKG